eukprot:2096587-Rhodomonas_salina.1
MRALSDADHVNVRQTAEARKVANAKEHVGRNQKVTCGYFQECLDGLRGAVMIAFPEGLPDYDEVLSLSL